MVYKVPEPKYFVVPAGTKRAQCRGCDEPIYWIETKSGKRAPIDCEQPGCHAPTKREDGQGVSHFPLCPKADEFRKTRRA